MDKTFGIIAIIVIILVIGIGFALLYKSPASTTTVPTVATTLATTTVNAAPKNTSNTIGSSLPVQTFNNTLTSTQVISILGTGWTSAQEYAVLNKTSTIQAAGSNFSAASYAAANFTGSNGGSYLVTGWLELKGIGSPASYINATLSGFSGANVTSGTYNNATYSYATGPTLYGGQEASFIYAYEGPYAVTMLYKGNSFTLSQGEQLISQQLTNLNVTG